MVTIDKSLEIFSGVDRVWEVVSNTDHDQEYWGAIRDVRVLKREGNRIEREALVGPRAFARRSMQTLVFDPKKSITLKLEGDSMAGERVVTLVPLGRKSTRVDVSWSLEVKDVPGFVQGIIGGQISKATEDALRKFKREAELTGGREQKNEPTGTRSGNGGGVPA